MKTMAEADMSTYVYTTEASHLRVDDYMCINNRPCKVTRIANYMMGKFGHRKLCINGTDIFTGDVYEEILLSTSIVEVPRVSKLEYEVTHVAGDGFISLFDVENNSIREDLALSAHPKGLARSLHRDFAADKYLLCTVVSAMGMEQICGFREAVEEAPRACSSEMSNFII